MAESIDPNVMRRLRYTPLRDLMRGRISGRLDLKARIAAANLPGPAKELITRVVRRTRLWLPEKIAVANELIAHFADGIEAGETIEQLIASFGDERSAARLMARAKRRNRPIVLKILVAFQMLLQVILVIFVICCIWFAIGRPSVKTDYLGVLNESVAKVPEDQRAWPVYRRAIAALGDSVQRSKLAKSELFDAQPGRDDWAAMYAWMQSHEDVVKLVRQGAQKPALGFVLGNEGSMFDPALWPGFGHAGGEPDPPLIRVQLPYLAELDTIGWILSADVRIAREQSNGKRLVLDIEAMLNLAEQLHGNFIISDFRSIGLRAEAFREIDRTLAESPGLLVNEDLQRLAHRIAAPAVAAGWVGVRGERLSMYDLLQRMYTDNGSGDGRLTPAGLRLLSSFRPYSGATDRRNILEYAQAAMSTATSSRREVLAKFDHLMDLGEANFAKPMREADWDTWNNEVTAMCRSQSLELKYLPLPIMMPSLSEVQANAERILGQRDGLLVGIALEMYRREHGGYPKTLNELTPLLLPSVPADRITGEPLHYRLIDGKPLVYSVGADRDDDGGRAPRYRGRPDPWDAARWNVAATNAVDGDWVVYPSPKNED